MARLRALLPFLPAQTAPDIRADEPRPLPRPAPPAPPEPSPAEQTVAAADAAIRASDAAPTQITLPAPAATGDAAADRAQDAAEAAIAEANRSAVSAAQSVAAATTPQGFDPAPLLARINAADLPEAQKQILTTLLDTATSDPARLPAALTRIEEMLQ